MPYLIKVVANLANSGGLPGASVYYFSAAGSVATTAEVNDVTGRVRAFYNALINYWAAGSKITVSATCNTLDAATGAITGITSGTPTGTVTGTGVDTLPPATMAGLTFRTGLPVGRRVLSGRAFLGPVGTNTGTAAGTPSSTFQGDLQAAGLLLGTGATAAAHQVWHRPNSIHTGGLAATVTAYVAAPKFWVLRSRRD